MIEAISAHNCTMDTCHVGCCPECATPETMIVRVGWHAWGVCEVHRIKWPVGVGLFSPGWEYSTARDFWNNLHRLAGYRNKDDGDRDAWRETVAYMLRLSLP